MSAATADASWTLLELCSIHDVASETTGVDLDEILATVDWDAVIALSLRHRLMPRLADFLIRSELMSTAPKAFRRPLTYALNTNRFNCDATVREAQRVVAAVRGAGGVVACTKGVVFQQSLYGGFGGRDFGDIDLMIDERDRHAVSEALPKLGYRPHAEHDFVTNTVVSRSRQELALHRMYPDHLPHFVREVAGHTLPFFDVDTCFNITWFGARGRSR